MGLATEKESWENLETPVEVTTPVVEVEVDEDEVSTEIIPT